MARTKSNESADAPKDQAADLKQPEMAEDGLLRGDPASLNKAAETEDNAGKTANSISQLDEVRFAEDEPENVTGFGENSEFTKPEDRR
jgi:hypothetical protein